MRGGEGEIPIRTLDTQPGNRRSWAGRPAGWLAYRGWLADNRRYMPVRRSGAAGTHVCSDPEAEAEMGWEWEWDGVVVDMCAEERKYTGSYS